MIPGYRTSQHACRTVTALIAILVLSVLSPVSLHAKKKKPVPA